ncbi:hypothetical protein FC826_11975 [Clostridium botulinum]|uniref:Uncharacterized protein n=1 Tax=Clostridium botulinum TaxID=1491 RepID=A0A6B4Z3W2_CLOBO|nr:hypothetical protein [Clostridium botulinum]NFD84760.1 hypothetical protein [Clostridium botulinum]NFE07310.1 hypothetical protein [Clostridium botulinum]NFE36002.1 hypothetical protein [Clostridium botulinum]NFE49664.1 hypothetical protein [Clostridium botulinum]
MAKPHIAFPSGKKFLMKKFDTLNQVSYLSIRVFFIFAWLKLSLF